MLDALTRWYAQPPADDLGLERALDHAGRVLRPGARMLVLADPQQAIRIPPARWSALAQHHDLSLVLLVDPLELRPPSAALQFQTAQQRIGLDLRRSEVQAHWQAHFVEPLQELRHQLGARASTCRCCPPMRPATPGWRRRRPRCRHERRAAVARCAAAAGTVMVAASPGYLMIGAVVVLVLLVIAVVMWRRRRRRERWLQLFDQELATAPTLRPNWRPSPDCCAVPHAMHGRAVNRCAMTPGGNADPQRTLADDHRSLLAEGAYRPRVDNRDVAAIRSWARERYLAMLLERRR